MGMLDSEVTAEWRCKAAIQHHAGAAYKLELQNEHSSVVEPDITKAIRWYEQTTEHSYAIAQYTLGLIYAKGSGVAPYTAMAAAWSQKAPIRI